MTAPEREMILTVALNGCISIISALCALKDIRAFYCLLLFYTVAEFIHYYHWSSFATQANLMMCKTNNDATNPLRVAKDCVAAQLYDCWRMTGSRNLTLTLPQERLGLTHTTGPKVQRCPWDRPACGVRVSRADMACMERRNVAGITNGKVCWMCPHRCVYTPQSCFPVKIWCQPFL